MSGEPPAAALDREYRQRILRTLGRLLVVLAVALPIMLAASLFGRDTVAEGVAIGMLFLATLVLGILYRRGHTLVVACGLVAALIVYSTWSVALFGSVRGLASLGFVAAVVAAGILLHRGAVIAVLLGCSLAIGGLILAELRGLLPAPRLEVGLQHWIIYTVALSGLALSILFGRELVIDALRRQSGELERRRRAEGELRASRERLARVFRNSPAAIVVQRMADWSIVDINRAFELMYGVSREEARGRTPHALGLWARREERLALTKRILREKRIERFPARGMRRDGSEFDAELTAELVEEQGEPLVLTIVTDVTAETAARRELERSQRRFREAFENSPIGMTITRLSDGRYLEVNAADERTLGWTRAELLGRTTVERGVWADAEDRRRFVERLRQDGAVLGLDMPMRDRRGEPVQCRVWASLIELDGEPCVLSSTLNVTEQRRQEALLRQVARGLSGETGAAFFAAAACSLAEAIGADMVVIGELLPGARAGVLGSCEDGQATGGWEYPLAGTPCAATGGVRGITHYPDRLGELFPGDGGVRARGLRGYLGLSLRDPEGAVIGVLSALYRNPVARTPQVDALLSIYAARTEAELLRLRREREIVALNQTLEERVRARTSELAALNAELDSFAYSVSHDLKAPLRAIDGFTRLLEESLAPHAGAEDRRLFEGVRRNVARMSRLINDLLELSRASSAGLDRRPTDLSALAAEVMQALRQSDPARPVEAVIAPGLAESCDPDLARVVLENLLGNAWKYSAGRPHPRIEFGELPGPEGRRRFCVRDNGVGFDMQYAGHLFKPFHRLHSEGEFEGTGIGLATVHRIVERHGGAIRAESAPGAGATFVFSLAPSAERLEQPGIDLR